MQLTGRKQEKPAEDLNFPDMARTGKPPGGRAGIGKTLYGGLAVAAWVVIGVLTLTPTPASIEESASTPLTCLVCGQAGAVDVFWNLLLFVPLGFALRMAGLSLGWVVALSAFTTLAVETIQFLAPGRDPSLSDLLTNTGGGAAGAILARAYPTLLRPPPSSLRYLLIGSAVVPVLALAGAAWLLQPSPPATLWYGHYAPDMGSFEQFEGTVHGAWIGDTILTYGPMPWLDTRRLRETGQMPRLAARFTSGPRVHGLAPIALVTDVHRKVLLLGQEGTNLVFEARIRGEDFRFRALGVAICGALPETIGVSLSARGEYDGKIVALAVESPSSRIVRNLRITPALGWALLSPVRRSIQSEAALVSAVFLMVLWSPLGFYTGRRLRGRPALWRPVLSAVPAMGAVLATGLVGLSSGLGIGGWPDWTGPIAGVGVGWLVSRWSRGDAEGAERSRS